MLKLLRNAVLMGLCAFSSDSSFAADKEGLLNKLLAPGKLIEGHKNLEGSDCLSCHNAGKGVPDQKCLDCHKELQSDITRKKGFHGKVEKDCIGCHSDHKGRDFDSTKVDQKTFNHKLTGFDLTGKHSKIKCSECHTEKRKDKHLRQSEPRFLGKTSGCRDCHLKDDPHHFEAALAKQDCDTCHGVKSWKKEIKFDHDKVTDFRLVGRHAKLECNDCHLKKDKKTPIYKWPDLKSKNCLACHEDVHKDKMNEKFGGGNCNKCHNQTAWKISNFNHEMTNYPLKASHSKLQCLDCHKQSDEAKAVGKKAYKWNDLSSQCSTCHKDIHLWGDHKSARLPEPTKCESCHSETKWKELHHFEHNKNTRYILDGKHLEVSCGKCHFELNTEKQPIKGIYAWADLETKTCENCHTSPHKETFSSSMQQKKCSDCHATADWKALRTGPGTFDHKKETRFDLTGKHQGLECAKCHQVNGEKKYQFAGVEKNFCDSCHANIHKEQFHTQLWEQACTECHTTESFTKRLNFDHSKTSFSLKGKHSEAKCSECHKPTSKMLSTQPPKPMSQFLFPGINETKCESCHKDFHKGEYGDACADCHQETSWKTTREFHKNFNLRGVHYSLGCSDCHQLNRRLGGLSEECIVCHQQDDIHNGSLPECKDCHRQDVWENSSFRHSMTNFALRGAHRSLECNDCHARNAYRGLSSQCISCHLADASQADSPVHDFPRFNDCQDCHSQFSFE